MDGIEVPECEDKWVEDESDPCGGEVHLIDCPYARDIHDEIVPVWLCEVHADNRAQEI